MVTVSYSIFAILHEIKAIQVINFLTSNLICMIVSSIELDLISVKRAFHVEKGSARVQHFDL